MPKENNQNKSVPLKMKISGNSYAVRKFVEMLQQTGHHKDNGQNKFSSLNVLNTETETRNGKEYLNVICEGQCQGTLKTSLCNADTNINIASQREKLGIAVEAYTGAKAPAIQEHIILDRGQIVAESQSRIKEYEISKMSNEEIETLLFEEGLANKAELLNMADEDGIYREGGLENYGRFQDLVNILEEEPRKFFPYESTWGGIYSITLAMNRYIENDNLYLAMGAFDEDLQGLDHFADITVNVGALPYLQSAIDTNNNGDKIMDFLQENGFGTPTGRTIRSGFCSFPVFKFNPDKLMEILPQQFKEYSLAHGVNPETMKNPIDQQIKSASVKTQSQTTNNRKLETGRE